LSAGSLIDNDVTSIMFKAEKVSFVTLDDVTIVGDVYRGTGHGPAALLLHMMPAIKESWSSFANVLLSQGFKIILAIDLRGHGESQLQTDKKLDFLEFSDQEHQLKIRDVITAVSWLEEQGATKDRLALIGASIGANLSIAYGAMNPEIPAVVALSPGLNYRGVTTEDKMSAYVGRALYLVASAEDTYSLETNQRLAALYSGATLKELNQVGHGTAMFDQSPDLMSEVAAWLIERVN